VNSAHSLSDWIAHVFDHPVTQREWYWEENAPRWEDSPANNALFIAETFERSGELLAPFSDEQLNQGFWYLVSNSCSEFMDLLVDESVPSTLRLCVLRSVVPVFDQVMAVRCSPHLSHLDEQGEKPLNSACYMWWDLLRFSFHPMLTFPKHQVMNQAWFQGLRDHLKLIFPKPLVNGQLHSEVPKVLRRLLAIPHDACRESALHGLGHCCDYYPGVADIIEEFLTHAANLRPELVAYAKRAKTGRIV
jgi:hypothetical protein